MKNLKNIIILCITMLCFSLVSCESKEDRVNRLVIDWLKSNGVVMEKYEKGHSSMTSAKQGALNDSAIWSLVPQWIQCIRMIDREAHRQYADPTFQEHMLDVGYIMANEYVDSINHRINQLDTTKILGYEFIHDGRIIMENNKVQEIKLRIITDLEVSKILLCVPVTDESERTMKIIEEAQHGKLTKLPIDPQKEIMYYLSTGKSKPSF